jgi:hypothetical protein
MDNKRTWLNESELEWLYRLLGHHTVAGGMAGIVYNVLANKMEFMGIEDKGPLNLVLPDYHPYGNRVMIKEVGEEE